MGEDRDTAEETGGPTPPEDRIVSLDALRGFALLGILVINVWFFGMPMAAGIHPPLWGDVSGLNYLAWLLSHVFFLEKFMTLFTIMFGAGVILFTAGKERRGEPVLRLHYRRTVLLLAIGLAHAYLLWYGDILAIYALCGFVVVFARDWSPRTLVRAGLGLVLVPSLLLLGTGLATLPVLESDELAELETTVLVELGADADAIEAEIAAYRGGWTAQSDHRIPTAIQFQTTEFVVGSFWRVAGLMLVGMALFKGGMLSNDRSPGWYRRVAVAGSAVGLVTIAAGIAYNEVHDWDLLHSLLIGAQFNYWGSIALAMAYVSGVMLWCRGRPSGRVTVGLAAVGRTALSNYLLQTVLATSLFYGHGLGLFAQLTRFELLGVVLLIWAIQVPLSVWWLRHFRFGPVEWVWRTLTYGEGQPIRLRE